MNGKLLLVGLAAVYFSLGAIAEPRPMQSVFFRYSAEDMDPFTELSAFTESIPVYVIPRIPKPDIRPFQKHQEYKKKYVRRVPESERRKTPYSLEDLMANPRANVDSDYARSGKPFFVYECVSRPLYFIPGDGCPLADRNAFSKWKENHTGFLGFNSLWEMDSDTTYFTRFWNLEDKELERDLHAGFEPMHAKGKGHIVSWTKEVFRRLKDFHWGESRIWPLCSNDMGFEHLFAANGACGLWYEATTQGWSAWNAAGAFLRGAARQWNLPYGWYMAQHYTGYTRDGKFCAGDSRWIARKSSSRKGAAPKALPYRGEGRSQHRRQALYGWLIGVDYIQMEGWKSIYQDMKDGKIVPSENALDFNEIYMLSKTVERGETYTPLAVLTPLSEPCSSMYRNQGLIEPETQKTIFNTLVPIASEHGGDYPLRNKGEQGCLYNSRFPGFFDALCPDAGQNSADFERALMRYKHLLIAGNAFDKERFDSRAIDAFKCAGGKVHRYPSEECPDAAALEKLLLAIRDETMPFSVEGDIQWGGNKTEKGFLVYLINNKGVIKFSDEKEEYNLAKTALVKVLYKATGEERVVEIAPGDFKLLEYKN
ncbi:MAG: hypothetical protein J6R80_00090 [Kiritimatiellae bacterium]|nr:hypothetical protein [Kiritimatiellia bacterium]